MTEKEARTKWCPFSRQSQSNDATYNRASDGGFNCIASDCMAWRPTGLKSDPEPSGFCGLAGEP